MADMKASRRTPEGFTCFEIEGVDFSVCIGERHLSGIKVNHNAIHFVVVQSAFGIGRRGDDQNARLVVIKSWWVIRAERDQGRQGQEAEALGRLNRGSQRLAKQMSGCAHEAESPESGSKTSEFG